MKLHDPDIVIGSTTYDAEDLGIPSLRCYSCGRLTAVSGDPCPTADTATTTNVYLTPYLGNVLTLLDGSDDYEHLAFAELTLALGTLTSGKNYTVYAYNNGGALKLEFSASWTNDTTESEARETVKGLVVKASDHTRRIVGVIRTISTTATCDIGGSGATPSQRFVSSLLNPVWRKVWVCPDYANDTSTTTVSYNSSSWAEYVSPTKRIEYLIAADDGDNARANLSFAGQPPNAQYGTLSVGIFDDSVSWNTLKAYTTKNSCYSNDYAANIITHCAPTAILRKAVGYHAIIPGARSSAVATIYVDYNLGGGANPDFPATFIEGEVLI